MAESVPSLALAGIRMVTPWSQLRVVRYMSHVPTGQCAVPAEALAFHMRTRLGPGAAKTLHLLPPHKGHSPGWS